MMKNVGGARREMDAIFSGLLLLLRAGWSSLLFLPFAVGLFEGGTFN